MDLVRTLVLVVGDFSFLPLLEVDFFDKSSLGDESFVFLRFFLWRVSFH